MSGEKSGRYDLMGDNLFKLTDRRDVDQVLGMTEEEIFAMLATEIFSYKDLAPDLVPDAYQIPRRAQAKVGSSPGA